MPPSIAPPAWQVNATDPMALTTLLDLPEFSVTRLDMIPTST